jgi:hypothetical protein
MLILHAISINLVLSPIPTYGRFHIFISLKSIKAVFTGYKINTSILVAF